MKRVLAFLVLAVLANCGQSELDLSKPPEPLGDFRLGHNIVVTTNAQRVPPSRAATAEEWEAVLKQEITRRFGRYEGDKYYHLGVSLDGYSLAVPGVPVVLAPKSAIVLTANVWDDAAGEKLNEEGKRLTVLEGLNGETVIGTGLTRSREEQMQALAFNAALSIERWLVKNRAEWFGHVDAVDGGAGVSDALPVAAETAGAEAPASN
ncbi:hypothetical protein [Actibacterium ureilyticum]|uniref:hypothetical protein n=1 Tax=Actibacterium ureilyticum TaxID=1590614 RepID=UPI0015954EEA|nr:hypothetical protein [Actibacterium ureilyticum]